MKPISKSNQPDSFVRWLQNNASVMWSDFSRLNYVVYSDLKHELLYQQNNICSYCEIGIKAKSDSHIEHLKPKDRFPGEIYSFHNLLASCQYSDSCGHKKGSNYFSDFVSPLDSTCQSRFTYTGSGKVIPANETDTHVTTTITLLGLNCKRLKDQRKSIIKCLEECKQELVEDYLENCVEWVNGFPSVLEYVLSKKKEVK